MAASEQTVDRLVTRALTARDQRRYASEGSEAEVIIDHLLSSLEKYAAWAKTFPSTMADARKAENVPPGAVWQRDFIAFWQPFDAIQKEMFELSDDLQSVLEEAGRPGLWRALERDLDPPHDAQIEFATAAGIFVDGPGSSSQIVHPIRRLEAWHRNFSRWVAGAIRHLKGLRSKV